MAAPETPVIEVVSPEGDIFPDFEWQTVSDDVTPAEDIDYYLDIYSGTVAEGTPIGSHVYEPGLPASQMYLGSWVSALSHGSYIARLRAYDGISYSGADTIEFIIRSYVIDPDEINVKAPTYIDPFLDVVRFFDKSTEGIYNKAKNTGEIILV